MVTNWIAPPAKYHKRFFWRKTKKKNTFSVFIIIIIIVIRRRIRYTPFSIISFVLIKFYLQFFILWLPPCIYFIFNFWPPLRVRALGRFARKTVSKNWWSMAWASWSKLIYFLLTVWLKYAHTKPEILEEKRKGKKIAKENCEWMTNYSGLISLRKYPHAAIYVFLPNCSKRFVHSKAKCWTQK